MTSAMIMSSDYGLEMLMGTSPVLTSSLLTGGRHAFMHHDLSRRWTGGSPTPMGGSLNCSGGARRSLRKKNCANSNVGPPRIGNGCRNQMLPIKSCLASRYVENNGNSDGDFKKKKVVFADTKGHPLIQVRLVTERPDSPPRWSVEFLEQVTGTVPSDPDEPTEHWEVTFSQPAADYLLWKQRLERDFVAVENAMIEDGSKSIKGTVKVRNISYHKKVVVRYTMNDWLSFSIVEAEYVPSHVNTENTYDLFDTFTFRIPLPNDHSTDRVEFCVCFYCNGLEHWDSNDGINYVVACRRPQLGPSSGLQGKGRAKDVYQVQLDSWGNFASWNHLNLDDSPYW